MSSLFSITSSASNTSSASESQSHYSRNSTRDLFQRTSSFCKSLLIPDIVSCEPSSGPATGADAEAEHGDLTEFSWNDELDDELNIPEELLEVQERSEHMRQDVDDRIVKYEKTYRDALELAKARYMNGSRNSAVVAMRKHYNYTL